MALETQWSNQFSKRGLTLTSLGNEWKNFMQECLMETDILKKGELDLVSDQRSCCNLAASIKKRGESLRDLSKAYPNPKEHIQTEARRYLREEYHEKLVREKEERIVNKEIERLKDALESYKRICQKDLKTEKNESGKWYTRTNLSKRYTRYWKRCESYDGFCEIDNWIGASVQMTMETKIKPNGVPFAVKVYLKRKAEDEKESIPERVSCNQKGSMASNQDFVASLPCWEVSENDGKNEIMQRFFNGCKNLIKVEERHTIMETAKSEFKPMESEDQNKIESERKIATMRSDISLHKSKNLLKERTNMWKIQRVWKAWRRITIKNMEKKNTKENYKNKIETFLAKLEESQAVTKIKPPLKRETEKGKNAKMGITERVIQRKQQFSQRAEEKEEKLQKILLEVKTSQKESQERLLRMKENKKICKNYESVPVFLVRMEERREERSRKWKDIKERKKKMEEEKEMLQKRMEDERKKMEEEGKRKMVAEAREKRKMEQERKEKEKKEREETKRKIKSAEAHHERLLVFAYGLRPWLKLMRLRMTEVQRAAEFDERNVLEKAFRRWKTWMEQEAQKKVERAEALNQKRLKVDCIRCWMKVRKERIDQFHVAIDWNELKVTEKIFVSWLRVTEEQQLDYLEREKAANLYHHRKLMYNCLIKWKNYPELKREEVAKEKRKRIWRQKVLEILPDYKPICLTEEP